MSYEFIELSTQVVIGSKYVPKEVICGPRSVLLWKWQRIHCRVSTIPRWLSFTSQELLTTSQITVVSQMDCLWQRDLSQLNRLQLQAATRVTNVELEMSMQKLLELKAKHFVSRYRVGDLITTYEADERQLTTTMRYHFRLKCCLLADIKEQLGSLGLVIKDLNINVTLPDHLRRELEALWRLEQFRGLTADLTELNLAEAIGNGQPVNLLLSKSTDFVNNYPIATSNREVTPFPQKRTNGHAHSK